MVSFKLEYTDEAKKQLSDLKNNPAAKKEYKAVLKALNYLSLNPGHPSLVTHKNTTFARKYGVEIWQSYAQNNTPGAYRIFWYYGPERKIITVVSAVPHPD